jgi:hypothetical protein
MQHLLLPLVLMGTLAVMALAVIMVMKWVNVDGDDQKDDE